MSGDIGAQLATFNISKHCTMGEKGGGLKFNVFHFKIRGRRREGVIGLGIHLSTLKNIKKDIF